MSGLAQQLAAELPREPGPGPGWVRALRDRGAEQFRQHGLPHHKDEAWKYTRLGLLDARGLQLATEAGLQTGKVSHPEPMVNADTRVNMLDGQILDQHGESPAGVTVVSLVDALGQQINGLKALLESLPDVGASTHGFTALNTATLGSGVFIHVAAGAKGGRVLLNWAARAHDVPLLTNSRVCVIVEAGASLELLEQFESLNANVSNIVVQADLGQGAEFQHIRFQQESEDTVLITRIEVSQQANSDYRHYSFDLGGGLVRHDSHTSLLGAGAKSGLNGAYLLDGNRHVDNHARVDHMAPACISEQYYRGVAGGRGRAVFNSAVCVHPGADGTEARQSNANILLSAQAEIDTKPELEVYADEVIASHGATVGQLDEQAVFYLRSRGLSEQAARQLLTTAFCRSVSDKLADPVLGELISQRMMDVMPKAD
jgi:Fe-S cluster assembly protein SufD